MKTIKLTDNEYEWLKNVIDIHLIYEEAIKEYEKPKTIYQNMLKSIITKFKLKQYDFSKKKDDKDEQIAKLEYGIKLLRRN